MENGNSKSLFTMLAIVLFGVFLSLSYWLFQDEMKSVLATVMDSTSEMTTKKLDNNGLIPTDVKYFTYTLNADNTVKITNYDASGGKDVIIPATIDGVPVTVLGRASFWNKGLESVIIPETVKKLEDSKYNTSSDPECYAGVFADNNLTSITLPNSLEYLGNSAFWKNDLVEVELGDGLKEIRADVFTGNPLTTIRFPSSLTRVGGYAFHGVPLTNIDFNGSNLTKIGYGAFSYTKITSVDLPSSLLNIEPYAFEGTKLVNVNLPENVKTIDKYAFYNCGLLKSITFHSGLTTISEYAFKGTLLKEVTIPTSTTVNNLSFENSVIIKRN